MSDKTHSNAASGQQADTHTQTETERERGRERGGTVGVARGSAESGKA